MPNRIFISTPHLTPPPLQCYSPDSSTKACCKTCLSVKLQNIDLSFRSKADPHFLMILRRVGSEVTIRLVLALIMSRGIDYCNSALAGLPQSTTAPLQRVQNASSLTGVRTWNEGTCYSKPCPTSLATSPLASPVQDMLLNALDPSWQLSGVSEEHRPICCCQPTSSWSPVSTFNRLRVAALTDQVRRACFLTRRSVCVQRTA